MKIITFEEFAKDATDKYDFYERDFRLNIQPNNPLVVLITREAYMEQYKEKYNALKIEYQFHVGEIERLKSCIDVHYKYLREECPITVLDEPVPESVIEEKELPTRHIENGILFKRCYDLTDKTFKECQAFFEIPLEFIHNNYELVEVSVDENHNPTYAFLDKQHKLWNVSTFECIGELNNDFEWIVSSSDHSIESVESNTSSSLEQKIDWNEYVNEHINDIQYPYQLLKLILNSPYTGYEIPTAVLEYIEQCELPTPSYKIESASKTKDLLIELTASIKQSLNTDENLFSAVWTKLNQLSVAADKATKQKRFEKIDLNVYREIQTILCDYIRRECNGEETKLDQSLIDKIDKFCLKKDKNNKFNILIYYAMFFLYAGVRPNCVRELYWNPTEEQNGFKLENDKIYFVHNHDKNVKKDFQRSKHLIENAELNMLLKYSLYNQLPENQLICDVPSKNESREFRNFTKQLVNIELTPTDVRTLDVNNDVLEHP